MTANDLITLGNTIFESKHFNPSQLGISSRQINYWIGNGLVPFTENIELVMDQERSSHKPIQTDNGTNKWVRLDMTQAVWVSIINELFKFRVSMDAMKQLTYQIWQKPRENKYADEVFYHHIKNNPFGLTKSQLDQLKSHLQNEEIMQHYFRTIINPFTDMVKSAVMRKGLPHSLLYIPDTFEHAFHYGDNTIITDLGSAYIENPMLSIPLGPIIAKVLLADFENKKRIDLEYLNNVERQIRDIIVFKRPKVVEIAFQDKNIEAIMVTEEHKSRQELAKYILRNKIKKGSKLLIDIRSNDNYKITLIKSEKL